MRYVLRLLVQLSTVLFAMFLAEAGSHAQQPARDAWTVGELDAAVDAASSVKDRGSSARLFLDLADALQKGGAGSRSPDIVRRAAFALAVAGPTNILSARVVEKLAVFGEVRTAESLIGAAATPTDRAMLLGRFGLGRAKAGDITAAVKAAAEIRSYANLDGGLGSVVPVTAIAEIGAALATSGAPDAAIHLADSLPDGVAKVRVLALSAFVLCDPNAGPGADLGNGRKLAERTSDLARATARTARMPYQQSTMIALASEGRAVCDGPEVALTFVRESLPPQQATLARGMVADQLAAKGQFDLARAFTLAPDPTNSQSLLDAAKRLLKEHDKDGARTAALQASRIALEQARGAAPHSNWADHLRLLSEIFGTLIELGEYDQAIETAQPNDEGPNRRQYYVRAVEGAIRNKDAEAVGRLVPIATYAVKQPKPDWGSVQLFYRLTRVLATGGFRDAAQLMYQQFGDATERSGQNPDLVMVAELQALLGNISVALTTADHAGPLTANQNGLAAVLGAVMAFDNLARRPTAEELLAETRRIAKSLPPIVPGRKAHALRAIVAGLAQQGNIDGALQAESGLEAEPRDILAGLRDDALSSIAAAQAKSGDLRGSFSTSIRVAEPNARFRSLLPLIATSAH
jgi:hypothetical protein